MMNLDKSNFNRFLVNLALVTVATAVYGAVLAAWRSPRMAAYVSIKLPCVFIGTTLTVSVFCWMVSLVAGAELRYREVLDAVFAAMAVSGSILLALAPIVLFMILTGAPDAGSRETMRFVHAAMTSTHVAVFIAAGVVGVMMLHSSLKRRVPATCHLATMMALWIVTFGVVGCQLGWILRPLVGSPNIVVEFLRADALASNFLESVCTQIIPNLIHQGNIP